MSGRDQLPYYKAYPRDFIEGTVGMPFELKGAYRLVLDAIYMQGGDLPDDERYISGLLGCSIRKWRSLRRALIEAGKIDVVGDYISNKRAHSELARVSSERRTKSENALGRNKNKGLQKLQQHYPEPEPDKEKRETEVSPKNGKVLPLKMADPELFEPEEAPVQAKSPYSALFEQWWEAYPRATGKGAAFKAFEKQRKKFGADLLFSALAEQLPELKRSATRERGKNFCPHPSTWLNTERFNDPAHQRKKSTLELLQEEYETDGARQISGPG